MRGFVKDIYLRPSCYNCKHKGDNSCADITLADFWGITKIFPDLNDDKGISLVVVNTDKGEWLFANIKESLYTRETDLGLAIKGNPSLVKSSLINPQAHKFLCEFKKKDLYAILKKYCVTTIFNKIKRKFQIFYK